MEPILKYPGAKWKLARWIIENMPPHESYLEPYFGSGAVFFNKEPARIETINDVDGEVVHFFKTCRDKKDELAEAIELTPWAREEFELADPRARTLEDVERARQFAIRCWMSFGGRQSSKTWRHSTGTKKNGGPDNPKLWNRLPRIIGEVADRLKDAQIENKPAVELITKFDGPEVLIYADPPYLRETRTLHGDQYHFEMTDSEHITFLETMNKHSGPAMISGYKSELYSRALEGWTAIEKPTVAERGIKRTETIWINARAASLLPTPALWPETRG